MKDKIRDTFDSLASVYTNTVDIESLYNTEYERPSMLRQLPQSLTNMDILDAGCAAGWYTQELASRGANVVAADISPEMVRSTIRRVGDKATVLCLDLEANLPFKDNSFDFIISSLTLHYIKDWSLTFSEFQRVLKPNGVFLFSIHHPFTDVKLLQNAHYFSTEMIIDNWIKEGKSFEVPFYRRPLHIILNETLNYFSIEKVIEPKPTMNFKAKAPEKYETLMNSPQFLIIKASLK
ncbi:MULTISPECIES: class I SAM-dependent methyltransferase [unclassified Bacillus (in: firmicutes)]|uniref:class I SAM-dependent methyltransferase n=1 Tax=unclassified Bacillus (in: firmicutes) TaxID=185979 RepID=UPI001BE7FE46|nr:MULTISPECIES: class I SAM-dependent methyltransferase [unclassified Bacillus (in: firmicutes)]MBT2640437.1 class I SAM-dependent methyltransferase [Bacillus sp. ISL-39]MBT2663361.1 class I SAM-dependent methyltransferase [Bacillus sp. ISL-45]